MNDDHTDGFDDSSHDGNDDDDDDDDDVRGDGPHEATATVEGVDDHD